LEKTVIAVGDSAKLEIIFYTKTYKKRVKKAPKIQTNEGAPDKVVRISTDITTRPDSTYPLIIDRYKLDMSQFTERKVDKMRFELHNVSDQKLEITLVSWPDEFFEVKLPKSIKPGSTGKGEVKLRKDVLLSSFEKSFTLEVNDESKTHFTVPVKRTVRKLGAEGLSASSKGGE